MAALSLFAVLAPALLGACTPLLQRPALRDGVAARGAKAIAIAVVQDGEGRLLGIDRVASLNKALVARGFEPRPLPGPKAPWPRASAARLALLRAWAVETGVPDLILVELEPTFFAQLDGRYRWTVTAQVHVGEVREGATPETAKTAIPIFLRFDHQRDDAAILEARDAWVRVALRAVDAYTSARE